MSYASSILGLLPGGRRAPGIGQLISKIETYLPPDQVERVREAYRVRRSRAQRPEAPVRRGLHHAPDRGRRHPGGPAPRRRDPDGRDPARRRRGHAVLGSRGRAALRQGSRRTRRRRDQARPGPVQEPQGSAGRELPQDDPRDGARHPRDHGQARGPHPQHAHARRDAAREAPRASRARRSTSTRRSPTGSASTRSSSSSRSSASARFTRSATASSSASSSARAATSASSCRRS